MAFVKAINTSASVWRQNTNQVVQQDGYLALLRSLVHYAGGKALPGAVTYSGTGNGTIDDIDGGVDAPTETWTIAMTSASAFTVTGSVSGAQSAGTVGTNYTTTGSTLTSLISFLIVAGGTDFIASDTFTIPVVTGPLKSPSGDQWILDRWSPFTTAGAGFNAIDDQVSNGVSGALIWHGQGNGNEAFHAGIAPIATPASQIWNWVLRAYTGFSSSESWDTNLNASPETFTALWNNDSVYWFVVNSRRIAAVWVVSTTLHSMYQGAILAYASPAEWPFPMASIGEKDDEEAWNSTAAQFTQGIITPSVNNGHLRDTAGAWLVFNDIAGSISNFPFSAQSTAGAPRGWWDAHENFPNGDDQLVPITLLEPAAINTPLTGNTHGVLDGCFAVTGFNLTAQTILTINSVEYLVVNDIFRNNRDDFWALELA